MINQQISTKSIARIAAIQTLYQFASSRGESDINSALIRMKEFYKGVIIGVILKETFSKLLKKLVFNTINTVHSVKSKFIKEKTNDINLINNVFFICKIKNQELFLK